MRVGVRSSRGARSHVPAAQAANVWAERSSGDPNAQANRLAPYRDAFVSRYGSLISPEAWDNWYQQLNAWGVTCDAFLAMSPDEQIRALRNSAFDPGTPESQIDAWYPLWPWQNRVPLYDAARGVALLCQDVKDGDPPPGTPEFLLNPWTEVKGVDPYVDPSKYNTTVEDMSTPKVVEPDSWTNGPQYGLYAPPTYVEQSQYNSVPGLYDQPVTLTPDPYVLPNQQYYDPNEYATKYGTPLDVPTSTPEPRQLTQEEYWAAAKICPSLSPGDPYYEANHCYLFEQQQKLAGAGSALKREAPMKICSVGMRRHAAHVQPPVQQYVPRYPAGQATMPAPPSGWLALGGAALIGYIVGKVL